MALTDLTDQEQYKMAKILTMRRTENCESCGQQRPLQVVVLNRKAFAVCDGCLPYQTD